MGFIGFMVQLAVAGLVLYMGYTVQLYWPILLLCPFGFMLGQFMRTSAKSRADRQIKFTQKVSNFLTAYVVFLVLTAVVFGVGFALLNVLEKRPPPGTGTW